MKSALSSEPWWAWVVVLVRLRHLARPLEPQSGIALRTLPIAGDGAMSWNGSAIRAQDFPVLAQMEGVGLDVALTPEDDAPFGDLIEDSQAAVPVEAVSFIQLQDDLRSVLATLSEREAGIVRLLLA